MRRLGFLLGLIGLLPAMQLRAAPNTAPDFQEVGELLRAHLPGVTAAELDQAALAGVLDRWHGKVTVVATATPGTTAATNALTLSEVRLAGGGMVYLRVARVAAGLDQELAAAYTRINATNHVNGVVLDLRYASGSDYAAAAATADLFLSQARPLLDWGEGLVSAKAKPLALAGPMTILVNSQTSGAAEALAGVLREAGVGLVLGARTAGNGAVTETFPLKNGEFLQIASRPVRLASGKALAPDGLAPDIEVPVAPDDERRYFAAEISSLTSVDQPDEGTAASEDDTNFPARRINEADLVRARRNNSGADLETGLDNLVTPTAKPAKPVVRDPVLARALDLLKGLAVVRQSGQN
ncbi:MAG TPA: S41 family peptidase [Dongiaceae bacterium]|nr:S41 family peptidase [Dongiaceae bacterium]